MRRIESDLEIIATLLPPAPATVVDVGCGDGDLACALAARGYRVVGLDLPGSPGPGVADGPAWASAVAQALPLADGSADAVLYLASFHHVPVELMSAALAEGRRVLGPGGVAIVLEPVNRPGSYAELIHLVEDERSIQHAALAVLEDCGAYGFRPGDRLEAYFERSLEDFYRLLERYVPEARRRAAGREAAKRLYGQAARDRSLSLDAVRLPSIVRVDTLRRL